MVAPPSPGDPDGAQKASWLEGGKCCPRRVMVSRNRSRPLVDFCLSRFTYSGRRGDGRVTRKCECIHDREQRAAKICKAESNGCVGKNKKEHFVGFGILIHLDSSKGEYEDVTCFFFGKTADHDRKVHKTLNS